MENSVILTLEQCESHFKELYLNFCGKSVCEPNHHVGPAAHSCYILHYIFDGLGTYRVDGRTYTLCKGEGFLIEPNVMSTYEADTQEPWKYIWVGFSGDLSPSLLKYMGFSHSNLTFTTSSGDKLCRIIETMLGSNRYSLENELFLQSQLSLFFSVLSHDLSTDSVAFQRNKHHYYVRAAQEFIHKHYAEDIKTQDIADHIKISRSYLNTLFQEILNISPGDYLTHFRLTLAHEQLQITDDPISRIANACGYHDPLVFSKNFKQMTGMTPSEFRKKKRMERKIKIENSRSAKQ